MESTTNAFRAELNSPAPTPQTLRFLRSILYQDGNAAQESKSCSKKAQNVTKKPARPRQPGNAKTKPLRKGESSFQIHVAARNETSELSPGERRKLATEALNTALRRLGQAAKAAGTAPKPCTAADSPPKQSQDVKPLHDRSPNKGTRNRNAEPEKKTPSTGAGGLEVTVECAQLALRFLRDSQKRAKEAAGDASLNTENAALALLDKTVTLGLVQQAQDQLSEIHKQYWGNFQRPLPPEKSLARLLLGRPDAADQHSELRFTMSMQSQGLRLAILAGAESLRSNALIHSLHLMTVGSPPWVTLQGFKNGLHDAEATGMQLRTISLALSKLYSTTLKSPRASSPMAQFELFCIALDIKFSSWKHLHNTIDPSRDVWRPFQSAAKRALSATQDAAESIAIIVRYLLLFQGYLKDAKYDNSIPPTIIDTLSQFPRELQPPTELLDFFEDQIQTANEVDVLPMHCLVAHWRLKDYSKSTTSVLEAVSRVEGAFQKYSSGSGSSLERVLLCAAHLRKTVVEAVASIATSRTEDRPLTSLCESALSLLYCSCTVLCTQVLSRLSCVEGNSNDSTVQALFSTLVKNIEAVLDVDRYVTAKTSDTAEEALRTCSATLDRLQLHISGTPMFASMCHMVGHLRVRLSNAWWSRYLNAVKRRSLQEQLQALKLSVHGLATLSNDQQKAAYLGLKHERLASCYIDLSDLVMARAAITSAFDFYLSEGALDEIVDLSLRGPFDRAWSESQTKPKIFTKILTTYTRLTLQLSSTVATTHLLLDRESLAPANRAILLEKQVYTLAEAELTKPQFRIGATSTQLLLDLLQQDQYRVCRLRLASNLLYWALKKRLSPVQCLIDPATVNKLLQSEQTQQEGIFLHPYESGLRSVISLQQGLFLGGTTSKQLEVSLRKLLQLISQCRNANDLSKFFDNLEVVASAVRSSVDYASYLENYVAKSSALEILSCMQDFGTQFRESSKLSILLQRAELHDNIQDPTSAAKFFAQFETTLESEPTDDVLEAEFALAYAEHHLEANNNDQCFRWIERAQAKWKNYRTFTKSSHMRLREQTILCRAAIITSRATFRRGELLEAIINGRQSVKIAAALWMSLEKVWNVDDNVVRDDSNDSSLHNLTVDLSKLELSLQPTTGLAPDTARFWRQIGLHNSAFRNLASLTAHCGLYQDAVYFYEQALRVAKKTKSWSQVNLISSELALVHARADEFNKAEAAILGMTSDSLDQSSSIPQAQAAINQGELYLRLNNLSLCHRYIDDVVRSLASKASSVNSQMKAPQKERVKSLKPQSRAAAKIPTAQPRAKTVPKSERDTHDKSPTYAQPQALKELAHQVAALQMRLNLVKNTTDMTAIEDDLSTTWSNNQEWNNATVEALGLVQSALRIFAQDTSTNVLAETAMALPVRYKSARKSGRFSFVQRAASPSLTKKTARGTKENRSRGGQESAQDGKELLVRAYETLERMKDTAEAEISSEEVHAAHKLLTKVSLLSTSLGQSLVSSSMDLILDVLAPMDIARARERLVIESEQVTSSTAFVQSWPKINSFRDSRTATHWQYNADLDTGMLPRSWSVVSLCLSEDRSELLVSRINSHRSPFVIRIPLSRPDMSETENEDLDFASAKAEMQRIIAAANISAHDSRGSSPDKTVRKAWFAERQTLDRQLALLLENIENVWFGGFRGLLCASDVDEELLSDFGQIISRTLDRHLPSRQKSSKHTVDKVELHNHVMELFLTLGNPETMELEDSITDLLYFVVDILQFNGEKNAYDEIDFDAMLVEVLDALQTYHNQKSKRAAERSHTIMILDKALQLFPWESMSCLKGRSVSRMPSAAAVWTRLRQMHDQPHDQDGIVIPSSDGAYILNPSSDLVSTQDTFEQLFKSQLPTFEAIVSRPPKEPEFESILHDKSLMLYFGHGGAAQYIRGRTIRKLDKCAVTMLMGCSSAKMTECGVYEPYGMPWNYINGGSPAVVGTLWDVTDRDIDRYAMEVIAEWGLIECDGVTDSKTGSRKKASAKGHSTAKGRSITQQRGKVSLDEAVAHGRDSCLLKYLNGAAPVMYGVPVFLE
ncbi:hypothetical protein PV08_00641 [Exophiala spinifera]|uniref:separase n=1 Tax=Exophiala spinifera TaxID=91928 RepID=A0A0D1YXS2_9EURO|nr:uncharacterized protein PV08_00641 [Exophiala spinifera]KIW20066.1 hypothetical protein PV08_00641 [Exophiala spinifera]